MTPIFIISFNRLTVLKKLIDRLIELGQERIIIVDNASTYEPLLQYYQEIGKVFEVLHMPGNYGHRVLTYLWEDPDFVKKYGLDLNNFIYTDNDVVPVDECPCDLVQKFNEVLAKYLTIEKVGLGLKIDDLPDSFDAKEHFIERESKFWKEKIHDQEIGIDLYPAAIDTTFACRRANTIPGGTGESFRTGSPYMARHLTSYIDSRHLSEEDQYYINVARKDETHFPGRY